MEINYRKAYSVHLNRDMEYKIYGHAGKPCIIFPPQNGKFFDFENFGMIASAQSFIDEGRIQFICVDSVDSESYSNESRDGYDRSYIHECWVHYMIEELIPDLAHQLHYDGKFMVSGCSMGGYHAMNLFLRFPDYIDQVLSLSGVFQVSYFFHGYMDETLYNNSPLDFLANMKEDHPYLDMYRSSKIIACVGKGAWENDMIHDAIQLENNFKRLHVDAWIDFWGDDVSHDWNWWLIQFPYFLGHLV